MSANINDAVDIEWRIVKIMALNKRIQRFGKNESSGWAPGESTELLENYRMDRLMFMVELEAFLK